ncbi:hypothetical protein TVAG_063320 [Trichomonas vaginalis G3]|uniref:Uncharacterized protein n=1 Tax=Trichomonas vaginalis (strain ATCC PRA-98 / G3) TaxID=412133 RepID=A2G5K2_TRIV3|nr:hypothetical protein TVAGG3_0921530 [Trichomonas vaginalis G3]EAX87563.1 hypothetical protein TVAG_063320 [Trichomonas vaginalis G3]KAI5485156.1 hypothetical protein TVAGG3_0921530 [Trichomonas vaginalis G3]|eukprot:XP_001300493.1 hypothetical protein [Trichomonas vaginalis G3]
MSDSSDDYNFFESRLISSVKFKYNQMNNMQEEEIARLKKVLREKQQQINIIRETNSRVLARHLEKKIQLHKEISNFQARHHGILKSEEQKMKYEIKELRARFKLELDKVNKMIEPDALLSSNTDDSILMNLKQNISRINEKNISEYLTLTTSIKNFSEDNIRQIKDIENLIATRKKLIKKIEKEIASIKDKNNLQRVEINKKIDKINQRISLLTTQFEMPQNRILEPSIDEIRRKFKLKLLKIRKQINLQKNANKKLIFQIQSESTEFDIINELMKQKTQQDSLSLTFSNLNQDIKLATARNNELKSLLKQLDPTLRNIRQRHYQLLSAIKATDYQINGRNGQYQRSTQISATQVEMSSMDS